MSFELLHSADVIKDHAIPVSVENFDTSTVVNAIGDNINFVLIGEASHGTQEFYHIRAEITKTLIEQKGFSAVVAESDWPDAYRVNRYVRGMGNDQNAVESLEDYKRFPRWMWRNTEVVEFVDWLRARNDRVAGATDERALSVPLTGYPMTHGTQRVEVDKKCGFYGMDLYSLHSSADAVIEYLENSDPEKAKIARERYACFEDFEEDTGKYGMLAALGLVESGQNAVVSQLVELHAPLLARCRKEGIAACDEAFFAWQNAHVVANAEKYYRAMFGSRDMSWNLRDQHMTETIAALHQHLGNAKIVVWAHNSHLGDARYTGSVKRGEWNVGQLMRQRFGPEQVYNIGFTTYHGHVTAAHEWGDIPQRMRIRGGLQGSYEELFHYVHIPSFLLFTRSLTWGMNIDPNLEKEVEKSRLERAIGVIYRPHTERQSHYFGAQIGKQFDAVIHVDNTNALEPLEKSPVWIGKGETTETVPDLFPTAV